MKRMIFALALVMTTTLLAAEPATKETNAADTGTRHSVRMLKAQFNSTGLGDGDTMQMLHEVATDLAPKLVGVEAGKLRDWFEILPSVGQSEMFIRMEITLRPEQGAKPVSRELADAIVEEMNRRMVDSFEKEIKGQVAIATQDLEEAEVRNKEMQVRAQEIRAKVRQLALRADVSAAGVTGAVTRLEEEKQRLELDLRGKMARREALEKQIAESAKLLEAKVADDAIAAELKKVVEAREQTLKRVEQVSASGQASQTEVSEAVARVAEARAKLLQQQRDAAIAAGGQTLVEMNKELLTLSIDVRALQAQLEFIGERLPGLGAAVEQLDALQQAEGQLKQANQNLDQATDTLRAMQSKARSAKQPKIVVTSAKDAPEVKDQTVAP